MAVTPISGDMRTSPPSHLTAMLTLIAPGPDARGALLSGVAVEYRVAYKVVPAGAGPDDYEAHELEQMETVLELPDPEPVGMAGEQMLEYGPPILEVKRAVRAAAGLEDDDEPIILTLKQA